MNKLQYPPSARKHSPAHSLPAPRPPDRPVSPVPPDSQTILRDLRALKAARQTAADLSAHILRDLRTRKSAARRRMRVLELKPVARVPVVLAPFEPLDLLDDCLVVAGHAHRAERRQRIHDPDHVGGRQLRPDKLDERRFDAQTRAPTHVVVIEEDGEQAHVWTIRFGLLIVDAPNRSRWF